MKLGIKPVETFKGIKFSLVVGYINAPSSLQLLHKYHGRKAMVLSADGDCIITIDGDCEVSIEHHLSQNVLGCIAIHPDFDKPYSDR